jgi:hypothetical protein
MRRLGLSVLTVCGFAFLSACNSGTGLVTGNNASIDSIVFTNGTSQTNDYFVALATGNYGEAAVQVNAQGVTGSGVDPQIVAGTTFTWAAAFAAADTPYVSGSSPTGFKKCGAPSTTPAIPIYYQPANSLVKAVLPANQASNVVYAAAVPGVEPVSPGESYCYHLVATQAGGGSTQGSVLVVVSNSP